MNSWLSGWVKKYYADVKGDLFSCFMVRNSGMGADHAQMGFMTPYVWMFIGTYEKLRRFVIEQNTITSLIQLEYSGFAGATVPICTFTLQKGKVVGYKGGYIRLSDFPGADQQAPRALEALAKPDCGWFYRADADEYGAIPGSPIAYWASRSALSSFGIGNSFGSLAFPSAGITTGDNATFIHFWWEQDISCISFSTKSFDGRSNSFKWFPCNKGGEFRKWYGNREYVMAFDDCSISTMRSLPGYRPVNLDKQFKPSISWSDITSGLNSFRANGSCALYDHVSISAFPSDSDFDFLLAFANSSVAAAFLSFLAPTLHCNAGDIAKLPVLEKKHFCGEQSVKECLNAAKLEWDSFEVSWDYKRHPLV